MSSELDADFARILDGLASYEETKDFLAASVERMGDPEALAAGARAMRARMIGVNAPEGAIDVCGTGGDGAHTLNISTAVAFVVAGAGVPVAKHGNRAMSSKCGAADVLEALGVKLTGDVPTLERCLREANIAFLFAQNHHPSMRHVAQARKELGHRTIFNLLGPLSNPANVKRQLIGVFAPEFVEPVLAAMRLLGLERACVVHGDGGLDELTGKNDIIKTFRQKPGREYSYGAGARVTSAGADLEALRGGSATENAAALRALLDGSSTNQTFRFVVGLNVVAALGLTDQRVDEALGSIDSGKALEALERLIAITQAAPEKPA